jgi:hypothetical protein
MPMERLNAIEAIAPAFRLAHETLFAPFRVGRTWKLAACSFLAYLGGSFSPIVMLVFLLPPNVLAHDVPLRTALYLIASGLTALSLIVLYVGARMELVAFEMLVTRSTTIGPMWRKYGRAVWPWIRLKVTVGTLMTIALGLSVYRLVWKWLLLIGTDDRAKDPQFGFRLFGGVVVCYIGYLVWFLLLKTVSSVLADFVLPFYVLENLSIKAARQRAWHTFERDRWSFVFYLLMKPVLATAGYLFQSILLNICMFPVWLIVWFFAVFGTLMHRHIGGPILWLLLGVAAGLILLCLFCLFVFLMIGMFGYLIALLESYGISFMGGRYPLLANMLELGPGAPFTPPPVFPSKEEREDDDGGPPMPMNPAVA